MYKPISILKSFNYEAYLVGGAVRDIVLGQEPKDIDIVTSATVTQILEVFKDYYIVETGLQHGTILVIIDHIHYEITTYRGELASLKDDLIKRDFTMNSLIYDEKVIDYVGGIEDINNRIIRSNGNPEDRFKEDPLRILRAIRFCSLLGFTIEEETLKAMYEDKELLLTVSKERIYDELKKILLGDDVVFVLINYIDIISVAIPELKLLVNFEQNNPYHIYNLLEHTAHVVDYSPKDEIVRLAALYHDIGKPQTHTVDQNGIAHYYRHELVGKDIAHKSLKALKSERKIMDSVCELVFMHDQEIALTKKSIKKVLMKISVEQFNRLIQLKIADNKAHNPKYRKEDDYFKQLYEICEAIINDNEVLSITDLAINGDDLIEMGFKPGPIIGEILLDCLNKCIEEQINNDYDSIKKYVIGLYKK